MQIHELKCERKFMQDVMFNNKNFEVRKNDRNFRVGDMLKLTDYDKETDSSNGTSVYREVTYILDGGQYGIEDGFVVLSLGVTR